MDEKIIIFDGVCNLCNWAVRFIVRHDSQAMFKFAAAQSETGQMLLRKYQLKVENPESVFLITKNKALKESAAVLEIAAALDGFWKLLVVFRLIPEPVRDRLYNWVARNRYRWFGKRDVCMLPNEELESRFL